MEKLKVYEENYNQIIEDESLTENEKEESLSLLLSQMAQEFGIPLFYSNDFKDKRKEVFNLFDTIVEKICEYA